MHEGGRNCLKYLKKGGGTEKTGGEIEILEMEGEAGSRAGCLKTEGGRAGTLSQTMAHLNRLHKLYMPLYVVHASCFSSL